MNASQFIYNHPFLESLHKLPQSVTITRTHVFVAERLYGKAVVLRLRDHMELIEVTQKHIRFLK